jgi:hypothetical protein
MYVLVVIDRKINYRSNVSLVYAIHVPGNVRKLAACYGRVKSLHTSTTDKHTKSSHTTDIYIR